MYKIGTRLNVVLMNMKEPKKKEEKHQKTELSEPWYFPHI
jgi:hypothetical protein